MFHFDYTSLSGASAFDWFELDWLLFGGFWKSTDCYFNFERALVINGNSFFFVDHQVSLLLLFNLQKRISALDGNPFRMQEEIVYSDVRQNLVIRMKNKLSNFCCYSSVTEISTKNYTLILWVRYSVGL